MGKYFGDFYRTYLYDSPDGQDCAKKVFHTTKVFGFWGAYMSLYDIIGVTKPKGFMAKAGRMMMYAGPAAGVGATFATTVCLMGQLRGKDAMSNHVAAAAAAAAFVGTVRGNANWGYAALMVGTISVAFVKMIRDQGYSVWGSAPMEGAMLERSRGMYSANKIMYNRREIAPPPDY